MKAIQWIMTAGVLAMLGGVSAQAQDDAYMTPSRAREWRQQEEARKAKAKAERAELERKYQEESKKYRQDREAVSDWYNRRDMKVTIEEMEQNLESLDRGDTPRGGKYSQRLRRFGGSSDVLVLENVDRVYVLDDMDYDPWSGSYYGYDHSSGVNITINTFPSYGGYYGHYYNGWYDRYRGFGYPYYGYRGYRYYDPWYYGGWDSYYAYHRPWRYGYYGAGYWDGYYDGAYSSRYYSRRNYNSYGRSTGSYYDRRATSRSAEYGRALGQGSTYTRSSGDSNGYYNRGTGNRSTGNRNGYNSGSRSTTTRRSNVDEGWTQRNNSNSGSYSPSRSTGNSGGSYSSPSRSTSPSRNTGNSGGTSRVRR